VNTLLEVFLGINERTIKRYFTRSIGAMNVLLTTPATPPLKKLFRIIS
jgi:hypothetical protein